MEQKKVVVILADISGYTRFMLENRVSAVHGQLCINSLIEAILSEVDIPLTLQEIEGDAVFLYAADSGAGGDWQATLEEVSRKLTRFFEVFIARAGLITESTPCGCAICRNSDKLGLKIVVHAGEALFHEVAGRPQVSGPDVILAHRLLKNSIESHEYLLLTAEAYRLMGAHLAGAFSDREESYEGFGRVPVRVRFLEEDLLAARDAVYRLSEPELNQAVGEYLDWVGDALPRAVRQQMRDPARHFGWFDRAMMWWESAVQFPLLSRVFKRSIPREQLARGRRRTAWAGRPDSL